jgi:hypothetical protein
MKIDGGCHCVAIRFEASVSPKLVMICHCTDCQTMSGAPYRVNVRVLRDRFRIEGEPRRYTKTAASGATVETAFCGVCGTPLYSFKDGSDSINLRLGIVAQRAQLTPALQGFCESALPWALDIRAIERVER